MKKSIQKIIFITGVSSGIGKISAEYLSNMGYKVYGTSRQKDIKEGSYKILNMDVTNDVSIQKAFNYILEKEDRIDVVINNAGTAIAGSVENSSIDEINFQFETNFLGIVRVCQSVIPVMREQERGLIINISSLSGLVGLPFQAYYSASKFAVEGLSEAMRFELKRFNIRVILVEPGDSRTHLTSNRVIIEKAKKTNPYQDQFIKTLNVIERNEINGVDPEKVARIIGRIIRSKSPKFRNTVCTPIQKTVPFLKKILPYRLFEKIIELHYQLH